MCDKDRLIKVMDFNSTVSPLRDTSISPFTVHIFVYKTCLLIERGSIVYNVRVKM